MFTFVILYYTLVIHYLKACTIENTLELKRYSLNRKEEPIEKGKS